jgi:hypothetical protein
MPADGEEKKLIPSHKLMASLILLSFDSEIQKAESLYKLYTAGKDAPWIEGTKIKEMGDHLYFLVLTALPSLVEE